MSKAFRVSFPLRFAHCDPAGIGYYPRYLELCDAAIEEWTEAVIGASRRTMHMELKLGLPTVDLRAQFARPSRLGDLLDIDIAVRSIGRSSIELGADVSCGGEPRFRIEFTQVLTCIETMRAKPWPGDWRERLMSVEEEEPAA